MTQRFSFTEHPHFPKIRVTKGRFFLQYLQSRHKYYALILLAITMIFTGLLAGPDLVYGLPYRLQSQPPMYYAHVTLLISGTIGLYLSFARLNGRIAMGIMSIGISIYMIFLTTISFGSMSAEIRFVIQALLIIAESVAIFFSVKLMIGQRVNSLRLRVIYGVYLIRFLVMFIEDWHNGATFIGGLANNATYFGPMLMIFITLIALSTGDSGYKSSFKVLRENVTTLEISDATFSDTYMIRADLIKLLTMGGEGWEESEHSDIDKQLEITIYNYLRRSNLTFRKWGDGVITGTFYPKDMKARLLKNINFPVRHIACLGGDRNTCTSVRIYGNTGFFIEILIRDFHIRKYRTAKELKYKLMIWRRIAKGISEDEVMD